MNDIDRRAAELAAMLGPADADRSRIEEFLSGMASESGPAAVCRVIDRCQLILGLRRPRIAVYDHTWQFIGGAQKYGATLAEALTDIGEVTLMGNRPFDTATLGGWYSLDLSACSVRIVPLPFFEEGKKDYIDPAVITSRSMENPFHAVSRASLEYDLFINNSMLEMVCPLSRSSAFITHFPERRARSYFYVDRYSRIVYNSRYTRHWIEQRWGLTPHVHLYPPVDMTPDSDDGEKESFILSAARFDPGGNKQQLDMLRAFRLLHRSRPDLCREWRLVLAGGSHGDNPYLRQVQEFVSAHPELPVDLHVNCTHETLSRLYRRASLFWHFCGLGQSDPALVEHFGMTVAEAMQNGCVPLVFDGGGMREIVENNQSGFLFSSISELLRFTSRLLESPDLRLRVSETARQNSRRFGKSVFAEQARALGEELLNRSGT